MPKVLLVDSDPFMHRVYAGRLMSHGYEILSATSASDAVSISQTQKPDAVLCDTHAFGGEGLNIVRTLASNEATSKIPVLCVSNNWEDVHKKDALAAGARVYGIKSHLTPTEVAAHIDSFIT